MNTNSAHVCFVAPNAFPVLSGAKHIPVIGGAELQVAIVAKLLASQGRPVSMICLDYGQPESIEIDGVRVLRAYKPTEGLPVVRFVWPRMTDIWRCLVRANADIYYQQTAGMLTGVVAAFARRNRRKSIFASASNPDLFARTPRIRFSRDRWIYHYGLRNVDRIFVQNDEQARLCRENFGRDSVLVPNCYAVPPVPDRSKQTVILWVSTIRRLKRPDLFLDLAEMLPHFQFRMIGGPGDGEHELYVETRKRADSLPNVEFLGFLPFDCVERHFDEALLLVNTSESEGVPNAFLQAWARGVPSVSFVDAGARLNGRLIGVVVRSSLELLQAVEQLASNSANRLSIGLQCIEYVQNRHSPEVVLPIYNRVFDELTCNGQRIQRRP